MDRNVSWRIAVTVRSVGVSVVLAMLVALLASVLRGDTLFNGSQLLNEPVSLAIRLNFQYIAHFYLIAGFVMGVIAAQVEIVLDRIKNR